jgi:hypothetical protein
LCDIADLPSSLDTAPAEPKPDKLELKIENLKLILNQLSYLKD